MAAVPANQHPLRRVLTALIGGGVAVFAACQLNEDTAWALLLIPSAYVTIQAMVAMLKSWDVPVVSADSDTIAHHPTPTAQINPATGMFLSPTGLDGSGQAFGGRPGNRP